MDRRIEVDVPVEYAEIQIFPSQNRYLAFACHGDKVENLATGRLEWLLPHLRKVHELYMEGSDTKFRLEPPENCHGATWFTKSTLNRFLHIVGSSELMQIINSIKDEMFKLEEARKFYLSPYGELPEAEITSSDASKNELLRAMDLRLAALRTEATLAFNQTADFTGSSNEIRDLLYFSEHFGSTDLKNSLYRVLGLNQNNGKSVPAYDSMNDNVNKKHGTVQIPKLINSTGVFPKELAQLEYLTKSNYSGSSLEDQRPVERSRTLVKHASPKRSASPMRRIQIGRMGSRRATTLNIKSFSHSPAREKELSHSSEKEESELLGKKPGDNASRLTVQDAINLFESKQRDQTRDFQMRRSLTNNCGSSNNLVVRRWSAGMGNSTSQSQSDSVSEKSRLMLPSNLKDDKIVVSTTEINLESNFMSTLPDPVWTAEVAVLDGTSCPIHTLADSSVTKAEEISERIKASAEWNQHKELELNQVLTEVIESNAVKYRKPQRSKSQTLSFKQRDGYYHQYKEKRDEKLRGVLIKKKAEKEAEFKAVILKGEIGPENVNGFARKNSQRKPQNSCKTSSQPEASKPLVIKKVSSKSSPLPATCKSWPSTPSARGTGTLAAKSGICSAESATRRKPHPAPSHPGSSPKRDKSQQRRSMKGMSEKKQPTIAKSAKATKTKVVATSGDGLCVAPAKPSFYNKVTRKSSVMPLESKPIGKNSQIRAPIVNKRKDYLQSEESITICRNPIKDVDSDVVINDSNLVIKHHKGNVLESDDVVIESQLEVNIHQESEVENFGQVASEGDNGLKNVAEPSSNIQAEEETTISPMPWVDIEEHHELSRAPQLAFAANSAPAGVTSSRVRYSLSQMLQEENGEASTIEWGKAEPARYMVCQKDVPKGFKRLLNFARKSKGNTRCGMSEDFNNHP